MYAIKKSVLNNKETYIISKLTMLLIQNKK